jgi:hypothetical protein
MTMTWDLKIDQRQGDLVTGYVTGQDEIVQRIYTRLWRHLGEWFVNTSVGLPWYAGPSSIMQGRLSPDGAILGSRDFRYADLWIRNEIAETEGVIRVIDFNTYFDASTRNYSIRAEIVTEFGLPYRIEMERTLTARDFIGEAI